MIAVWYLGSERLRRHDRWMVVMMAMMAAQALHIEFNVP
jgi:hypothetical protein